LCDSAGVSAPAAAAPSGVVTFLFTDVEGSTRRWEADADAIGEWRLLEFTESSTRRVRGS